MSREVIVNKDKSVPGASIAIQAGYIALWLLT